MRGGVNAGGRMTRKRTLYDLREIAKRESEYWARVFDELLFMYLLGQPRRQRGLHLPADVHRLRQQQRGGTGLTRTTNCSPRCRRHHPDRQDRRWTTPASMKLSTIDRLVPRRR
jgi:hypothetical protein